MHLDGSDNHGIVCFEIGIYNYQVIKTNDLFVNGAFLLDLFWS